MIISIGMGRIVNDFKMSRWRYHIGHTGLELRRQLWAEVKNRQGIEGRDGWDCLGRVDKVRKGDLRMRFE